MIQFSVGLSQFAAFPLSGVDSNGNPAPIHGTATIDEPTFAFLFNYGGGIDICPIIQPDPGDSYTVNVAVHAFSANGTPLPVVNLQLTVNGSAVSDQALSVVVGSPVAVNPGNTDYGIPVNPLNPTISF